MLTLFQIRSAAATGTVCCWRRCVISAEPPFEWLSGMPIAAVEAMARRRGWHLCAAPATAPVPVAAAADRIWLEAA